MTTSTHDTVTVRPQPGGWALLRIDNPPINLLDDRVYRELTEALEGLERDPDTRVVVLESADPDFFSAHFAVDLGPEQITEVAALYPRIIRALQSPNLISIAKIRGRARGGGHELTLLCDMRFASADATFIAQPEIVAGLIPGGGALPLLPRFIGRGRALELMLSGRNIDGPTAERYGVVNRALPEAELDDHVAELAARIGGHSAQALAEIKKAVGRSTLPSLDEFTTDSAAFEKLLTAPEVREAVGAQLAAGLQTRGPIEYNLGG